MMKSCNKSRLDQGKKHNQSDHGLKQKSVRLGERKSEIAVKAVTSKAVLTSARGHMVWAGIAQKYTHTDRHTDTHTHARTHAHTTHARTHARTHTHTDTTVVIFEPLRMHKHHYTDAKTVRAHIYAQL